MQDILIDHFKNSLNSHPSILSNLSLLFIEEPVSNKASIDKYHDCTGIPVKSFLLFLLQKKPTSSVFVTGLTATLYNIDHSSLIISPSFNSHEQRKKRLYIKYVDTTGCFTPRELQSVVTFSFVSSFLHAIQEVEKSLSADCYELVEINLFSSPQPSLIFSKSHENPLKGSLKGIFLCKWWLKLLCSHFQQQSISHKHSCQRKEFAHHQTNKICIFSPFLDDFIKKNILKDLFLNSDDNISIDWSFPFANYQDETNNCENSSIQNNEWKIPLYEDDVKYQHYKALCHKDINKNRKTRISLDEFVGTLCLRGEFSQNLQSFLIRTHSKTVDNEKFCHCRKIAATPTYATNNIFLISKIMKSLENKSFDSLINSTKSTNEIINEFKLIPLYLSGSVDIDEKFSHSSILAHSTKIVNTTLESIDIQSLVKRKRIS